MEIGNRIKKYRESNNLSQEELADKIFVSRQTLSNWENNKFYPDIKSITMLSNIFDVSLDDFIKGDLEEMKERIKESDKNNFKVLSWIYTFELLIMVLSAYPLMIKGGVICIGIWIIIVIITITTSFKIEKLKNQYNIHTYKEIVAFYDDKKLSHDERNVELGKRKYQGIILAACSALIAIIVMIIMNLIFK